MRVVVTRPPHSGERTARRLAAMGHEAVLLPLSRPVHDGTATRDALNATTGAIAVTSAEALRVMAGAAGDLQLHHDRPLFAVGKATAQEAAAIGFTAIVTADGGGAELADAVRDHWHAIPRSPLLYLAGSPRAAGFEARLTELAIPFTVAESYRMEEIAQEEAVLRRVFVTERADAVLLYSRQAALRFFRLPVIGRHPAAFEDVRFLCLSAAVAAALPPRWRHCAEIATLPEENGLLALLAKS
jgi:uroporphyrinogen-III synthase